jgi:hypothetical protein
MSKYKRLLLWTGSLVVLTAAGLLGMVLLWPRSPINRANFEKIREGMTYQEVEAIFGGLAGNYSTGPLMLETSSNAGSTADSILGQLLILNLQRDDLKLRWTKADGLCWLSDSGLVLVHFDREGGVRAKDFWAVQRRSESLLDRLRRWLGL